MDRVDLFFSVCEIRKAVGPPNKFMEMVGEKVRESVIPRIEKNLRSGVMTQLMIEDTYRTFMLALLMNAKPPGWDNLWKLRVTVTIPCSSMVGDKSPLLWEGEKEEVDTPIVTEVPK